MNVHFVISGEHRSTVDQLLTGAPARVRMYALNIRDVQLIATSLRLRFIRLLSSGCEVTIAFGESLWDRNTWQPLDQTSLKVIEFLSELQSHGARVWYVPDPMLHAKVLYVEEPIEAGRQSTHALVTGANFSENGLGGGNFEVGVAFSDLDLSPHLRTRLKKFTDGVLGAGRSLQDVVREV